MTFEKCCQLTVPGSASIVLQQVKILNSQNASKFPEKFSEINPIVIINFSKMNSTVIVDFSKLVA